jgi:rRNA-processing protein FCF1
LREDTDLVDAENIRRSVWANIPEQQLVECAAWAERHRRRLVLVFDGQAPVGRAACETVAARNADDWIADAAAGLNHYWLVTSDRELRRRAGERALRVIGGGSFARELQRR